MARPEIETIITRIRALLLAFNDSSLGMLGTDVTTGASVSVLPAYDVVEGGATRYESGRRYIVTRTFRVLIYVTEIPDLTHDPTVKAALSSARAWIDPLADYLGTHKYGLNTGAAGSALVTAVGDVVDAGAGGMDYNKKKYSGFILEIPITYGR